MQCSTCEILNDKVCRIIQTHFGEERPIHFGHDWIKSSDGNLSEDIQIKAIRTLRELKAIAESFGASEFSAVATEVFRKAHNGPDFLNRVREIGIEVNILSQEVEAELGFATIVATTEADPDGMCVWDSGAASFQITSQSSPNDRSHLNSYMGALGTSVVVGILFRDIRDIPIASNNINPVTSHEGSLLMDRLTSMLDVTVPQWLKGKHVVYGVAGPNSIFKICVRVLTTLRQNLTTNDVIDTTTNTTTNKLDDHSTPITSFTIDDARLALQSCIGLRDEELYPFVDFAHSDGPQVLVTKLCLLCAVMEHTQVQKIICVECIGVCAGLMVENRFWTLAN